MLTHFLHFVGYFLCVLGMFGIFEAARPNPIDEDRLDNFFVGTVLLIIGLSFSYFTSLP